MLRMRAAFRPATLPSGNTQAPRQCGMRWSGERTIGWRAYRTRLRTHQTENTTNAIARTTNNADSIPWNNQYRSYG